jgi:hypothetical protein
MKNETGAVATQPGRPAMRIGLIVLTASLTYGVPWMADRLATELLPLHADLLVHLFLHHGLQAAMALAMIGLWARGKTADFGLRWPDRSPTSGQLPDCAWRLQCWSRSFVTRQI